MISRYEKQAVRSAMCFVISLVVAGGAAGLAWVWPAPGFIFGLLLTLIFLGSCVSTAVHYVRAILELGRAKGHSAGFFASIFAGPLLAVPANALLGPAWALGVLIGLGPLLPLIIAVFMPDESNPARDEEDLKYRGTRCVQCDGRVPGNVKLCPHCGWTQPACDVAAPMAPSASTASSAP